jgi:hypothetical protein
MTITGTYVPAPTESAEVGQTLDYQSGFGNGFETEALPGALPIGRNSPQKCADCEKLTILDRKPVHLRSGLPVDVQMSK